MRYAVTPPTTPSPLSIHGVKNAFKHAKLFLRYPHNM
jgi:hypothetical protein